MKHLFNKIFLALAMLCSFQAQAVFVKNMPTNQIQPNGDTIHIFVTGDEFYHRYHDANNYTIVQNKAGYWVYAQADKAGSIVPTQYVVNAVSPEQVGLTPGVAISNQEYQRRRHEWDIPEQYKSNVPKDSERNHGDFCNLVIFIRFADDTNYTRSFASVDQMFSDSTRSTSTSVYNYFKHASYNQLFVRTVYAPTPAGNRILSYQSPHPRAYYMPYSEANPIGYTPADRTQREFDLYVGCIDWINDSCPVPSSYNLDYNNDGYIDNVNFVVTGSYTGWNDLLWPHKWNLYTTEKFINNKKVSTFNLALEGSGNEYFGPSTFSHEMFHSLGAPDLYRYYTGTDVSPVGTWDLMATNASPQQHSTAYVKQKYGNWIDTIPLITEPGIYTLSSVGDSVPGRMALRFPSADPDQFYVVEYRDNTETFETKLPGKGLIIYRVDTRFEGNAGWDGAGNYDEIWIFRPNSTDSYESGSLPEAYFTPARNRTEFSPSTNPYPHLSDGTRDLGFAITNISTPGNTCTFRYSTRPIPSSLANQRITTSTANISWQGNGDAYSIAYRLAGTNDPYTFVRTPYTNATLTGLEPNQRYEWTVRALYDLTPDFQYADSTKQAKALTFHTELCYNATIDTVGWYTIEERTGVPFVSNANYNYSQQLYLASELGEAKNISTISLHYAHTTNLEKSNCTIYLANTSLANFNESTPPVPFSQLTPVFAGDLVFTQGWNEIILQTPFEYNGTDNLLVAIDDNSGTPSRAGHRFYVHNTNDRNAIIYSSENQNPNPADDDTIRGSVNRTTQRCNIKFTGCPINPSKAYACIISDNPHHGLVSGEGLYELNQEITVQAFPTLGYVFTSWSDSVTLNPRQITLTSDTLLIAYFGRNAAITPATNEAGFVVISRQLTVTVDGALQQPIALFDIMGRPIATASRQHTNPVTFQVPHSGIYLLKVGSQPPTKIYVR